MDPNQWPYNNTYRLNTGIPTNPRFDLPLIDQTGAGGQGLGAIPAHTSLAQPRALGGLPTMNYAGHPAMAGVTQFLDTLGTSIAASQQPYKTVTVGQPAYTLESPTRTIESRVPVSPSPSTTISPKTWDIPSFVPSTMSTPFSGLPQDLATSSGYPAPLIEPPPAHSRNPPSARASTIQRNPYQKDFGQQPLQPVTAHSGISRGNQGVPAYSALSSEREPPVAHSHNQFSTYGSSDAPSQSRSHTHSHSSHQQSVNSSLRNTPDSLGNHHTFPNSPQLQQPQTQQRVQETYSYSRGISSNTFVNSNKMPSHINTSSSMSYEAVSPAPPQTISDSQNNDTFNTSMSLQDLADISSNQEKLPLQRHQHLHNSPITTWASSNQTVHLPKVARRESNTALSSPQSHLGSPNMVTSVAESPMHQPSPSNVNHGSVGSPQVGMSLGSPQAASSTVAPPQMPVQAIPDSTTKPKKRTRKRKEKQDVPLEIQNTSFNTSPVSIQQYTDMSFNVGDGQTNFNPNQQDYTYIDSQQQQPPPVTNSAHQESVFMTNAFGNSFINPHEPMGTHHQEEKNHHEDMKQNNPRQQEEVDEEFAHLITPPEPNANADTSKGAEGKPSGSSQSAFQSSFLSFLQGHKGETLSQVTNSNIQRPPMPKYTPDLRPVVPLESRVKEEQPSRKRPEAESSMAFSDDEDGSQGNVNKTVQNVITSLSGDEDDTTRSRTVNPKRGRGRGSGRGRGRGAGSTRGISLRKRRPSWEANEEEEITTVKELESDDVIEEPPVSRKKAPSPIIPRERTTRKAKEKIESKRKEKEEKKNKRKSSILASGSESDLTLSSDDEVAPVEKDYDSDKDPAWRPTALPDFQPRPDSDTEYGPTIMRRGRGRGKKIRITSSKTGRSRGRSNKVYPADVPVKEPPAAVASPETSTLEDKSEDSMGPAPVPEPVHLPSDDEEEPAHRFMKGDFVLERKDMANYDSYPVWKIDAGRLIQKFEPFTKDGRMIHKAMSTYSSWSDAIRHQFKAIKVRILQIGRGQGQEQVEVLEQFRPEPPETNEDEDEELMPSFNIYMQILISQALEPGFLAAINEEKDEYYHGPLRDVDKVVEASRLKLEAIVTKLWRDTVKEHVDLYPECKVFERPNTSTLCQATRGPGIPASQAVILSGEIYDRETLEPKPSQALVKKEYMCNAGTIRLLPIYHKLQHYRHTTYQSCLSKVVSLRETNKDLENRDILDQCLQNRLWVQKIFRELKSLIRQAGEKT